MKNLAMSLAFAAASGTAHALPPVLSPATYTTNLAVGFLVGPPDANNRLNTGFNPLGGQVVGGLIPREINGACQSSPVGCFGSASSNVTTFPGASADAAASYSVGGTIPDGVTLPQNALVGGVATTTLQYQFSVNGPSGTTAYVDLTSFMAASGANVPGVLLSSLGGFRIDGPDGVWVSTYLYGGGANPTLQRNTRDLQGNLTFNSVPTPGLGQYFENEVIPFAANTAYTVYLYATADAQQLVVGTGNNVGSGSADGYVDPQFTIDPMTPNASAYSLAFSDGVGNAALVTPVPEPATAWTLAMGLGWLAWRRRSSKSS